MFRPEEKLSDAGESILLQPVITYGASDTMPHFHPLRNAPPPRTAAVARAAPPTQRAGLGAVLPPL
jgi:hypothetical protein